MSVTALAVAQTTDGDLVGVSAGIEARATTGSGKVFVATEPLAELDMQGSAKLAARVAAGTLGLDWRDHDYLVSFRSESPVIGGPSAGAVMALALAAALQDLHGEAWELDPGVAATGTINPDGTIGPVGGIPEKAEGAARAGVHTFLFPAGQEAPIVQNGLFAFQVNMTDHCASLGIACRSVTTLRELVEAAAGVRLERPDIDVPTTADYGERLAPAATDELDELRDRLAAAEVALAAASMMDQQRDRVQQSLDTAAARLGVAEAALAGERYYTTVTMTFQGLIWVGEAEILTEYFASGDPDALARAVTDCADAVQTAQDLAFPLNATGANAFYAIGAAQQRASAAEDLYQQAAARFNAFGQALQSAFSSSFCMERAATVSWWAGLHDLFGVGPTLDGQEERAQQAIDLAAETTSYADAVLSTFGSDGGALDQARSHFEAGRMAAAAVTAVEAQVNAMVAVQTGTGQQIPVSVLDAARATASQAVDQARSAGVEPVLAVSLIELSDDQEQPADALLNLWTARGLALLVADDAVPRAPVQTATDRPAPPPRIVAGYDDEDMTAALLIGSLLGAAAVALIAVAISMAVRRD